MRMGRNRLFPNCFSIEHFSLTDFAQSVKDSATLSFLGFFRDSTLPMIYSAQGCDLPLEVVVRAAARKPGFASFKGPWGTVLTWGEGKRVAPGSDWGAQVKALLNPTVLEASMPFSGGVVGYVGYEAGRWCERMPEPLAERALPDLALWRTEGGLWLPDVHADWIAGGSDAFVEDAAELLETLTEEKPPALPLPTGKINDIGDPVGFLDGVQRILSFIESGDCYQANLSRRLVIENPGDPVDAAVRLARQHPAACEALLSLPGRNWVVCNSPELYLAVEGAAVETHPIKGTRPRGDTDVEDARLCAELESDEKERCELTMIVDMARNDLSRVCRAGSVQADSRVMKVLPTVFHAEQVVRGVLSEGHDAVDALVATFPPASVTGAPKVRAMEIIAGLEPVVRGVYTGAVGFFSDGGDARFSVAIRTATFAGNQAHVQVGSGIVADSVPIRELEETHWKAAGWLAALLDSDSAVSTTQEVGM